jgi:hypothetical protein
VSSIRSSIQSPNPRFATAESALPMCSVPVGLGAKRTRLISPSCALAAALAHREDVPEAQGIYRGEVYEIMGALSDIVTDTKEILAILKATIRRTMKKKKVTREAYQAWWDSREARVQALHAHMKRIEAELAAHKKQG